MQTEYAFTLPKGFVDSGGQLHRQGRMRLATARDEIEPLRDPRVRDNEAFLTVIILARVIQHVGAITSVDTQVIEGLFTADLAYLQDLYTAINFGTEEDIAALEIDDDPFEPPAAPPIAAAG